MTIRFLRNKVVEVTPLPDGSLAVSWRLTDDLLKAEVNLTIQPPDLEITQAEVELDRLVPRAWSTAPQLIKKIEGVRVGAGLRKIVLGLLGGPDGCSLLVDAVLESANAVILHFTRPVIQVGEYLEGDEKMSHLRVINFLFHPNMRCCVSFQDDSPIMQGLEGDKNDHV